MPTPPEQKIQAPLTWSSKRHRLVRFSLWASIALTVGGSLLFAIQWSIYSREADSYLTYFAIRVPKTITKVLDRNGDIIGVFAEEHRVVIPYGDIPRAFIGGIIATEDTGFLKHRGVDPKGFVRAAWNFVKSGGKRKEGASTLTMQLVRTVTAKRQKQLDRKLKEIILATKLEKAYSKRQILEMYANEVYFGGGRYGIESAAQYYFGKSAPQLLPEEAAMLAGLVQNPNWYNPYNPDPKSRAAAKVRRDHVLRRMVVEHYLKESDAETLIQRPIRLARENAQEEQIAPYVVEEVRKYLYEKYGREAVLNGGLEVTTTIDSLWQAGANEAVQKGLRNVDRRRGFRKDTIQIVNDPDNAKQPGWNRYFEAGDSVRGIILGWKNGTASVRIGHATLDVPPSSFAWAGKGIQKVLIRGTNPRFLIKEQKEGLPAKVELDQEPEVEAALLAIDPRSGEIRAMVGGYDFNRSKFNRAIQAQRQVGSSMKAFVYGAAFEQGKTSASIVNDIPTTFVDAQYFSVYTSAEGIATARPMVRGAKSYEPKNYERDFWGPIPIWEAIRDSRNVAAVRTLEETGIQNTIAFARKAGIQSTIPAYPSLALGAADLNLREMTRAYATIVNGGVQCPQPFFIKRIVDRNGRELESFLGSPGDPLIDPAVAFELIQCLQGAATAGTGSRTNELNWPVAGKTGTTNDHTDAWFLGFSTRIACGVWVGLDTKKTIYKGADGGKVAVPIWVEFMKTALPTTPREDFKAPDNMEWANIDRMTGLLASGATTDKVLHLAFPRGTVPKESTDAEAIKKILEAKAKANSQAPEIKFWGQGLPKDQPAESVDFTKMEAPKEQ